MFDSTVHQSRYGNTAIALHWLVALLLPIQLALGWYMLSIEEQPGSEWYFALHISIGLTIALLVVLRIFWRMRHPAPGDRRIRPSATSRSSARRTVTRPTPNSRIKCISPGMPAAKRPSSSCSRSTR